MTTQRDLERALDAFFAQGADELADRVIDDALLTIENTKQRRVLGVPWRSNIINPFARLAVAAAAIVIVAGGAFYLLSPGNQGVGGPPAATPPPPSAAAASASPSAPTPTQTPIDPATWVPYTSERYGYTLEHPADWTIKPAQSDWGPGSIHSEFSTWADEISDLQGGDIAGDYTIFAGRQDLEAGQTPESVDRPIHQQQGARRRRRLRRHRGRPVRAGRDRRRDRAAGRNGLCERGLLHRRHRRSRWVRVPRGGRDGSEFDRRAGCRLFEAVLTSFRFAAS